MGIDEFVDVMPDTVTIAPVSTHDKYAEVSAGSAVTYPARVVGKVQGVRGPSGQEWTSTVTVYLGQVPASLTPDDVLTLPARFNPRSPKILAVQYEPDETGLHHVAVLC